LDGIGEQSLAGRPHWRLVEGADLRTISFDDGVVLHHALTNGTHRISGAAAAVLSELRQCGPMTSSEVAACFDTTADLAAAVLGQLTEIDAVERC
jgi:hypothetical protein